MKKIITAATIAGVLSLSLSAPAAAKIKEHPKIQDGSAGYMLGCMIGWYVFDMDHMCMELQP